MAINGCSSKVRDNNVPQEEQVEIIISPAIDLFGLISRLADVNQYKELLLPEYIAKAENYFGHLRDHPCIAYARECNAIHQINGDAPMALAVYVGPPPELKLRMDLSDIPASFDPRWDSALISSYLEHARIFAHESNFMEFHKGVQEYLTLAKANLYKMINREQIFHWYKDFFGYYPENFLVYMALLNGSSSYGYPVFYPDGEVEFVSLIGGRFPNKAHVPTYPKDWFLPVIIHEYTHSYINPLIKSMPEEFKELGEAMLVTHRAAMIEHGYNVWNVILQEYIVRACTIRYLEQMVSSKAAKKNLANDISGGFTEIEGVVSLLDTYENNRDNYRDIESFVPQIKRYFESCLD